jgi:hypothetical protein
VGCGGDDPLKLLPDSSTSPSGSLPDLNMYIPPPLPTPLDVDAHSPPGSNISYMNTSQRKFSQPVVSLPRIYCFSICIRVIVLRI